MKGTLVLAGALGFVCVMIARAQTPAPGLPAATNDTTPPSLQAARDPGYQALIATCKNPPARGGGRAGGGATGAARAGGEGRAGAGGRAGAPAQTGSIVVEPATEIPGLIKGGAEWKFVWQERGNNGDGIVGVADGGVLLAQNDKSQIVEVYPDGKSKVLYANTHTSGAVAITKKGVIYANERGLHERVEELAPKRQVFADHFPNGDPLDCGGLLNDLTAAANGGLYYTGGPYYVDPKGVVTKEGGDDAPGGNGIILSPDEKTLYITGRMRNAPPAPMGYGGGLVAFDVQPDGHLANARQFAQTCGDGSTIDAEGRIYCTGGRIPDPKDPTKSLVGVGVIDPKDGHVLGIIPAPGGSAISVAFGGKDRKTLFLLHSGGREADGTTPIRVTPANPLGQGAQLWAIQMEAQGYKGRAK